MHNVAIHVHYAKGISLHISNKSFYEAMHLVWRSPAFSDYEPVKLVFKSTGKVLYMDRNFFDAYLRKKITLEELVQETECLDVCRNTKALRTECGTEIEEQRLWKLTPTNMLLIDDDETVVAAKSKLLFESA